jgi:phosphoribosyl-ATP pyrophosphohydrolase
MIYRLFEIIAERKEFQRQGSYTNELLASGQNRILQKVGEECVELIIAAANQGEERIIEEFADLLYHSFVLLASCDISLAQVEEELQKRHLGEHRG